MATESRKKRALRYTRNIAIAFGVLLVLAVGAGVAYTWYMGQFTTPPAALVEETETKVYTQIKPTEQAENVPQGVSVQSLTSPIVPGENALVMIKTNPNSLCKIKVEYNKIPSTDSGLTEKTSNEFGMVTWAWTVEATVPEGKWPVMVTCARGEKSGVVIGDLVVKNE